LKIYPKKNITGRGVATTYLNSSLITGGCFYSPGSIKGVSGGESGGDYELAIDASRVVPTSSENRPYNMALVPLIAY